MAQTGGLAAVLSAPVGAAMSSGWRRLLYSLAAVALLCTLCAPLFIDNVDHTAPKAVAGVIDLSRFASLPRPVELAGDWTLTWRSGPPGPPLAAARPAPVPGNWAAGPSPLPEHGAASYHLTIKGLKPGRYMLYVPTVHAASRVIADGRVLSEQGVAGATRAATDPTVRAHDVVIDVGDRPLQLQLDVSDFHERNSGIEGAPLFGAAKPMSAWITLHWLRSLLLVTSCLTLGCYGLVVFVFRRRELGWLYFSIAVFSLIPVMGVFAHDNLMLVALPDLPLIWMRIIEYLSVTLALSTVVAYTDQLFPQESPRLTFRLVQGVVALDAIAYAAAAVTGGVQALSDVSYWSLWVRIGCLLYVLAIVFAATLRRREGAAIYLLGMTFFFLSMMYTDLIINGFLPRAGASLDLMPLGMLVMLHAQLVIMAERWARAIGAAEQTSGELRQLLDVNVAIASEIRLEALLRRIVQVTSQIIHADRSSLFLYDERTDELWSMVAEGVESKEIRFPSTSGLAGDSFTRQAPINVTDAYADERFNQKVDQATGYHTHTVLTVPVTTRDGRRLGVMQAFNRRDGQPFSDADIARLTALGAQAAVAIENATLFAEVATERNYNESILRSMSSGVITLDREARFAKLNAAACAILGVKAEAAAAPATQRRLARNNPWLAPEIQAVAESGRPKTFLDVDLKTARGDVISANISIVPLIAEQEQAGLLIIVEDISEAKRVQGAMRRFMTQEVVDQIMSRDDELLFGAACEASVLFADIRNFTTLAEKLSPRDTVDMLNEIFTELFEAVAANGGVLDKFIGDALMAVYGAPLSSGRDPLNAVQSAVSMIGMIDGINERARARGLPEVRLGVGIVICEETAKAVEGEYALRELDTLKVRGRSRPARVFQVLTKEAQLSEPALDAYARGRAALFAGRWDAAVAAFEAALEIAPDDGPSALMLARARILAQTPPPAGWDGVWDSAQAA